MAAEPRDKDERAAPLVISLNCINDCSMEQDALAGIAAVEHVSLSQLADGRIESAAVVLLHSLAYLPRAAQRRLRHWQLILCLGSSDRSVDSALALDLGLRLLHIDTSRAEEIADTVMALFLGLLRRTHLLSHHSLSASGWLGSIQPLCRGMRRCRGLVLGIVGRSASATSLATRSLAFSMSVLYFEVEQGEGKTKRLYPRFPSLARKMDTLNDLLAASDLISLHCALTNETVQILNSECLQHVKPGTFLVNTCSSQLLDDCAVKQLLIDGTLAGCALDGAEGPQWMEAWVKEMPNVLILPRSADYSEEVWMEIREKTVSVLKSFFIDDIFPLDAVSDDDDIDGNGGRDSSTENEEGIDKLVGSRELPSSSVHNLIDGIEVIQESQQRGNIHLESESQFQAQSVCKGDRSSKKAKRKHGRHKSLRESYEPLEPEKGSTSHQEDDTVMSSTDQMLSSTSFISSSGHSRNQKPMTESVEESTSQLHIRLDKGINRHYDDLLKDGFVVALVARDRHALHVSRQRQGGGWFLDTLSNVTSRDPASQFLIVFSNKDTFGFRSVAAGGKLLQVNRRGEFVFASYSFDAGEGWILEGSLSNCSIVNCRNHSAVLEVQILVLAAPEEDGVTRWVESFDVEDTKLPPLT